MKCIILFTAILLLYTNNIFASNSKKLVIVRGHGNYPPEEMIYKNTLQGFHIDLINAVAKRLSYSVEFRSIPWPRAIREVKNGYADAISYISKNEERAKFLIYNERNITSEANIGLFCLKENKEKIKFNGDFKSLRNFKVGTIRGYSLGSKFNNATFLKKDFSSSKELHLVNKILLKYIDLGIANINIINFITRKNKSRDKIHLIRPTISDLPLYLAFSRKKNLESLAIKFGIELEKFKKTSSYKKIRNKWYGSN